MMIARSESFFRWNAGQARKFAERRALVVIGMTETKINGVALIIKLRLFRARIVDEFRDALHLFFVRGDQAFESARKVDQPGFRFLSHEVYHFREDGLCGSKKLGVFARATFVPIAEWFPMRAAFRFSKDIAFARENEIGMNGKFEVEQSRLQKFDGASGIDGPDGAVSLQIADEMDAIRVEHGIAVMSDEGAVEVGADKSNRRTHRRC